MYRYTTKNVLYVPRIANIISANLFVTHQWCILSMFGRMYYSKDVKNKAPPTDLRLFAHCTDIQILSH